MARELKHIDISNSPELLRIVEEVRASNEPQVLQREHVDLAIVRPVKQGMRQRIPRGKPFTKDDAIWNLKGIGRSGVSDVSENADTYLAEAYLNPHAEGV